METALSWEGASGLPPEVARIFPDASLLQAIVEYPVILPGGGNASKNDVFALLADRSGQIVCMIEAKRDEPFGPLLSEWLKNASAGKQTRLAAICACLGLKSEDVPGEIRYQLLHRAASAVLTAQAYRTDRAAMVVQSFSPERNWLDDFTAFCALLGRDAGPDLNVSTILPNGTALQLAWVTSPLSERAA